VNQVQFVDHYRIIGITRPREESARRSLVVWDTATSKERQLIFEMPTKKGEISYKPKSLVGHGGVPAGAGLHRSDPTRRAVGILCHGIRGKVHQDDDHMIVINTADVCAFASRNTNATTRIPWRKWERFTTVITIAPSVTKATAISGCRLFAMTKGISGWNFIELLRMYDFSPGTRSGQYPNRPPVRDILLNLGRGTVDEGVKTWCFLEDSLLLFHVGMRPFPVRGRMKADLLVWCCIDPAP